MVVAGQNSCMIMYGVSTHDHIRSCMIVCSCVQFSADLWIMPENRICTDYLQKSINSYMHGLILGTIKSVQMCGYIHLI